MNDLRGWSGRQKIWGEMNVYVNTQDVLSSWFQGFLPALYQTCMPQQTAQIQDCQPVGLKDAWRLFREFFYIKYSNVLLARSGSIFIELILIFRYFSPKNNTIKAS